MHSKNDLFNTDWSVRPPPSLLPRSDIVARPPPPPLSTSQETQGPIAPGPTLVQISKTSDAGVDEEASKVKGTPELVRAPSEVGLSARSNSFATIIRPSEALEVQVLTESQLGHGRHAIVHIGLYRENVRNMPDRYPGSEANETATSTANSPLYTGEDARKPWKVCAVKRFDPGKDAQVACLSEALMLSRLSKCENVVQYLGLKDEGQSTSRRPSSSSLTSSGPGEPAIAQGSVGPDGWEETTLSSDASGHGNSSRKPDESVPSKSLYPAVGSGLPQLPSTNGTRSTPSSPLLRPSKARDAISIPPLFSIQALSTQHSQLSDNVSGQGANLRRGATMKVPKRHSRLAPSDAKLSISTLKIQTDDPPRMLLLTELCALGNLASFVREYGDRFLGQRLFFKLAIDLMTALVATHEKNIIHGDVKPQNCLLTDTFDLRLADYSSSIFNSSDLIDGIGLGTTQYACPEIVKVPPSPFSFPIDIFAAGLTLLFMITGVEPYENLMSTSSQRSDRLTPLSPRSVSSRNVSGSATPTRASRRKFRTSSGAGKMVELHLHLAKGHAWEWEERRRYEEIEDQMYHEDTAELQSHLKHLEGDEHVIHLNDFGMGSTSLGAHLPTGDIVLPKRLVDDPASTHMHRQSFYADGHTPVQKYLAGSAQVPESLRKLIEQMLRPAASQRPTASEALHELKAIVNHFYTPSENL